MAIKLIIRRQGAAATAPPFAEQVFDEPIITIGSDAAATLRLDDSAIAPEQAIILNEDGYLLLINRAHGTQLNGEVLAREARRQLSHGHTLHVGPFIINITLNDGAQHYTAAATTTAPPGAERAGRESEPNTPAASRRDRDDRSSPDAARQEDSNAAPGGNAQGGSFAAILDSLRTEEDSFYFEVVSVTRGRRRVAIEGAEMLIGWDETGRDVSCNSASVVAPRGVVRKDWSGVVVQPHGPGTIEVNGEPIEAVRRLRNGDRLTLLPTATTIDARESFLVFHEPATLVVLDSLLPQQLPPPVAPEPKAAPDDDATIQELPLAQKTPDKLSAPRRAIISSGRRYFGYFTFAEVVVMIVGTLVAAVIIFLILEYL